MRMSDGSGLRRRTTIIGGKRATIANGEERWNERLGWVGEE